MKKHASGCGLRVLAAAILAVCGSGEVRAQSGGIPLWTNYYPSAETYDLAIDGGGNLIVAGWQAANYLTVKYSSSGALLWANQFNGPANVYDRALAVAADTAGNVLVTGRSDGDGCATIKYSADGVALWTNYLDASWCETLSVGASGNVFVGGHAGGGIIVAYSSAGMPLWTNRFGPTNALSGVSKVVVDGNGNVILAGSSVIKYSGLGAPLWTNSGANDVAVDANGNVFTAGSAVTKYSPAGLSLWSTYGSGAAAVAVDPSGNVYAAGTQLSDASGNYDLVTRKYSGAGVLLWTSVHNGVLNLDEQFAGMAVDGSGNVFVCGDSIEDWGWGEYFWRALTTVGYSSAGARLWSAHYESATGGGVGTSSAGAVAVDPGGHVFVVGSAYRFPSGMASLLIKYSPASSAAPPRLNISGGGNMVVISWPSAAADFFLQENTDVHSPSHWSNVTGTIQDNGMQKRVVLDYPSGSRIYRLFKP